MLAALARCQATSAPLHRLALAPGIASSLLTACSSGRALSAAAAAAPPPAATADQPAAAPWRQRFEDVSPGSVLRVDLPHVEAELSITVGEHEALELSGSSRELAAQQAEHGGHPGASLGALACWAAGLVLVLLASCCEHEMLHVCGCKLLRA